MGFNSIIQFLVPKETKFFTLFEGVAENVEKGAVLLNKLMLLIDNEEERINLIYQIKQCEEKEDRTLTQIEKKHAWALALAARFSEPFSLSKIISPFDYPFEEERINRLDALVKQRDKLPKNEKSR